MTGRLPLRNRRSVSAAPTRAPRPSRGGGRVSSPGIGPHHPGCDASPAGRSVSRNKGCSSLTAPRGERENQDPQSPSATAPGKPAPAASARLPYLDPADVLRVAQRTACGCWWGRPRWCCPMPGAARVADGSTDTRANLPPVENRGVSASPRPASSSTTRPSWPTLASWTPDAPGRWSRSGASLFVAQRAACGSWCALSGLAHAAQSALREYAQSDGTQYVKPRRPHSAQYPLTCGPVARR